MRYAGPMREAARIEAGSMPANMETGAVPAAPEPGIVIPGTVIPRTVIPVVMPGPVPIVIGMPGAVIPGIEVPGTVKPRAVPMIEVPEIPRRKSPGVVISPGKGRIGHDDIAVLDRGRPALGTGRSAFCQKVVHFRIGNACRRRNGGTGVDAVVEVLRTQLTRRRAG